MQDMVHAQLVRCMVDIGDLAQGYTKGGQYLQIKVGDSKPAFYAIASPPSPMAQIELLVKNQGDTAQILCDSKAGGAAIDCPLLRASCYPCGVHRAMPDGVLLQGMPSMRAP